MLTARKHSDDFKLNRDIHIHVLPMSNLYTLRGNDLRTIGSHHKFTQSKMQFCPYRGKGPCMRKCVCICIELLQNLVP